MKTLVADSAEPTRAETTSAKPEPTGDGSVIDHIAIFVLIDALGWTYLQNRRFLDDLLPYRRPLKTVLGFSSAAIPTILTGLSPERHGHWNLVYYDPKGSPFKWLRLFDALPDRILDNRLSRKILQQLGRHVLGMGRLFDCAVRPRLLPFFNWVEKRNIYAQRGITGSPSIFDKLEQNRISYRVYSYHHATDTEIIDQAERDVRLRDARVLFLYLCELDGFLHMHCDHEHDIDERIGFYARGLRRIFNAAREADPGAALTVFSDHGMTPVRNEFDLLQHVGSIGLHTPEDYLAVYDSTMARFWFFNDRARKAIHDSLRELSCGRLLEDAELQKLGVFFADRRYGEAVFLLHPGCLISRSDFNGGRWLPAGMHGYHPDDPYSDAIFLADRPPAFEVSTIEDVHRCMSQAAFGPTPCKIQSFPS